MRGKILAIGRALGGGISSFIYSIPMLVVALIVLGVSSLTPILLLALIAFVFASGLVGVAMSIALWLRSGDKLDILMGVSDSLLVRLSTIFYPIVVLTPIALYYLAKVNPVSHAVDLLRAISIPEYVQGVTVSDPTIMASYILGFAIASILSAMTLLEKRIGGLWQVMDFASTLIVAYRDLQRFWKYKRWLAGLVAMNLADIFIFALVFRGIVRRDVIPGYFYSLAPGIASIAAFAVAFTIGREVMMELRRGFHHYLLSLPVSRTALVLDARRCCERCYLPSHF